MFQPDPLARRSATQPAVTQLGVELPQIDDAPLPIDGLKEPAIDLSPAVRHHCRAPVPGVQLAA